MIDDLERNRLACPPELLVELRRRTAVQLDLVSRRLRNGSTRLLRRGPDQASVARALVEAVVVVPVPVVTPTPKAKSDLVNAPVVIEFQGERRDRVPVPVALIQTTGRDVAEPPVGRDDLSRLR